jgi:hypothetical protein
MDFADVHTKLRVHPKIPSSGWYSVRGGLGIMRSTPGDARFVEHSGMDPTNYLNVLIT